MPGAGMMLLAPAGTGICAREDASDAVANWSRRLASYPLVRKKMILLIQKVAGGVDLASGIYKKNFARIQIAYGKALQFLLVS